ncbi:MAG TPA: RNA ligase (ATP) [Candidatus Obscuribacterales bacterium]
MSTLKVEVVTIDDVQKHPNADRLDCLIVKGWNVVAAKGHVPGEKVAYVPIDSILPPPLEAHLFPPDSKVKLSKSRVRTIKLRGAISQGMIIPLDDLINFDPEFSEARVGDDLTARLGITKYEPPEDSVPDHMRPHHSPKLSNPWFRKYTDIEHFKNHNRLFEPGEHVYITEKLHGTSARYGMLPTAPRKWWQKLLKFLHLLPDHEFCIGSRNVHLQAQGNKCFYDSNVYAKMAKFHRLADVLQPGEILFGEIVGDGIQKGYTYGCRQGEHDFYAYDVMINGEYLDAPDFVKWCDLRHIPRVPVYYWGVFDDALKGLAKGDSVIGGQKVREGIVIKPSIERNTHMGRKVLKLINEDYELAKDNSDFH